MNAGIFNVGADAAASATTVAQSLVGRSNRHPAAITPTSTTGSTSGATAPGSASGDITSNDFLTLLVTEMKNQDPTQPTDPNAYIQQLTEVNSLQQLIAINQDLSPTAGTGATGSGASTPVGAAQGV